MKKKVYLLVYTLLLLGFSCVSYAQAPAFTGGHSQAMDVCKNSGPTSIDTLMKVSDTSTGHTVSWSVFTAPSHGSLVATYTSTSTGGTLTPAGLTYMPAAGYSGTDWYTVEFADGSAVDTTMINVTIDTPLDPGTVTGPASVCVGNSIVLSDATTGGVWSVTNTTASVTGAGSVSGVHGGIDTVSYSLTNACGIAGAIQMITVTPLPNAGSLPALDSICAGSHHALAPGGDAGGVWHSSNTVTATVNDTGRVTGITPGTSYITYVVTNGCGADTALTEIKVQGHVLPIIGGDTLCPGNLMTLLDPSAGGTWSSSSITVAFAFDGEVIGFTSGVATISYSLHNACGTTTATLNVTVETAADCDTTTTVSGVKGATNAKAELSIYPNPNNGSFFINLASGTNEQAGVIITNVVGEKVMEFSTVTNQALEVKIDKPAGLYFVNVSTSNGKSYRAKVLVTR